jgi:hypothetical protein
LPLQVFTQIMVGIYFLQAMVIAVLAVKKFPYAAFIIPLIIFTIIFHKVFGSMFARPWTLGNAREAALLDARDHVSDDDAAAAAAAEAEAATCILAAAAPAVCPSTPRSSIRYNKYAHFFLLRKKNKQ